MCRCFGSGVLRMRVTLAANKQAEVWGKPIGHSLSPVLHQTAYAALGIDAVYTAREVDLESLPDRVAELGPDYLGISLTMPLKEAVLDLVPSHRGAVSQLGAANTIQMTPSGPVLWNTDPAGIIGALADYGITEPRHVVVLGAGATARSAVLAVASLGALRVSIVSRDRGRSLPVLELASHLGLEASWRDIETLGQHNDGDLVINTLPNGVDVSGTLSSATVQGAALLDVTYHPWPSALALRFSESSQPVISGRSMLVHQAVVQIRVFSTGDPDRALQSEPKVVDAMKLSIGLPAVSATS
jgi:shikimate dehydrogenase